MSPQGQQPPQTSQLSKSRCPADTRFLHTIIFIFCRVSLDSPRYLEVGVRARLFKSSVAPREPLSLSLSSFVPAHSRSTFHLSLFVTRNTRALRNRATPAAGQAWMSDSREPRVCAWPRVRSIFRPSPRLRRDLFTPAGKFGRHFATVYHRRRPTQRVLANLCNLRATQHTIAQWSTDVDERPRIFSDSLRLKQLRKVELEINYSERVLRISWKYFENASNWLKILWEYFELVENSLRILWEYFELVGDTLRIFRISWKYFKNTLS